MKSDEKERANGGGFFSYLIIILFAAGVVSLAAHDYLATEKNGGTQAHLPKVDAKVASLLEEFKRDSTGAKARLSGAFSEKGLIKSLVPEVLKEKRDGSDAPRDTQGESRFFGDGGSLMKSMRELKEGALPAAKNDGENIHSSESHDTEALDKALERY